MLLFYWLLFHALLPLSPAVLVWVAGNLVPAKKRSFFDLIRDGQLLFYCTFTLSVALKDITMGSVSGMPAVTMLFCVLIVIFSFAFGVVALHRDETDPNVIGWFSITCAVLTIALVGGTRLSEGLL
uniref:Uncharacterized protein n=1 Tax=Candidatus Kentrum sp. FM TaxID=2126340 RepID=A0A450W111_9GAMM|nr:MAG: hypothetical protein BECKFM1743A_GA0114220_101377 [Candidatus Kentron sp. FM]VFJ55672.1 MAG: hypothetical protein BECKFM1743C_GA0114222_101626 [Candidatus Kentron sp. FM]VFK10777.1 MAG: hypothetical protein BECKFM1743B_GA0114221_101546 [Candidatus Kentron sp. FM]